MELYSYIVIHMAGEPRALVKANPGNGLEAWRRSNTRYSPATVRTELGCAARLIQHGNVKDIRHLQSVIEKWEEDFRLQQDRTGHSPLQDDTMRTMWQGAFAPHRAEKSNRKGWWHMTAQESGRDIVKSLKDIITTRVTEQNRESREGETHRSPPAQESIATPNGGTPSSTGTTGAWEPSGVGTTRAERTGQGEARHRIEKNQDVASVGRMVRAKLSPPPPAPARPVRAQEGRAATASPKTSRSDDIVIATTSPDVGRSDHTMTKAIGRPAPARPVHAQASRTGGIPPPGPSAGGGNGQVSAAADASSNCPAPPRSTHAQEACGIGGIR